MSESELQTINQAGAVILAQEVPVNPWVSIIQKSVEKGADISTIEKFIDLQREEEDRQAKRAFHAAMSKFQSLMPEISKTGIAKFKTKTGFTEYNFDKLNDICNAIRPCLQETGLSYGFKMKQEGVPGTGKAILLISLVVALSVVGGYHWVMWG